MPEHFFSIKSPPFECFPLVPTFIVYELYTSLHKLGQGGVVAGHGELAELTPALRRPRPTVFLLLLLGFLLLLLFSLLEVKRKVQISRYHQDKNRHRVSMKETPKLLSQYCFGYHIMPKEPWSRNEALLQVHHM